jgi:HAD superfamily hydrolase (TIGR01459 family)
MNKPALQNKSDLLIESLSVVADQYDYYMIDIWGVLHDGVRPFTGTIDCLKNLKEQGKFVCLLSNTPSRGPDVVEDLAVFGITRDLYDNIVTAGDSAFQALKAYQGKRGWYAGNHAGAPLIKGLDIEVVGNPSDADFMINDLYDLSETEQRVVAPLLKEAANKKLDMICGNPDLVVNVGNQLKECPGTYAALYETMGGNVIYHGKPHAPVYETVWDLMGNPDKSKILAIGDSFHTDIHGANNFGIDSAFHLVGIHWEEVRQTRAPDEADPDKITAMVEKQKHKPTYALAAFCW